jgi:hypothetical protein
VDITQLLQIHAYNVHLLQIAAHVIRPPKLAFLAMPGISWQIRPLAYNVRKSITATPAIKRLTLASLAIMVTIYHQLLAALPVPLSHYNAHYAVMLRRVLPVILVII